MKQPYPFNPIEDSLIGSIINQVFKEEDLEKTFQEAILSYKSEESHYFFTPRSKKQTILDIYPSKIRVWILQKKHEEIKNFFFDLLKGKLTGLPSMDIALELFEWILTGFLEEELNKILLELLTNFQITISSEQVSKIQKKYFEFLEQEKTSNS